MTETTITGTATTANAPAPRSIWLTGASGFVGGHLRRTLAQAYPDATLLTDDVEVRDAAAVARAAESASPDVCVHLAAIATVGAAREDEDQAWAVNLHGTLHVAHALLRHAPQCQMLFVSTADAYGTAPSDAPITEAAPLAPRNLYAATKAAADLALGAMALQGLRVVRLRPFNHTGPGQSPDLVVAAFARQIARIEAGLQAPCLDVGNLDPWRDFLDVRDVCAAYLACIQHRAALPPGTILNIGSGQARRIGAVLDELAALAGVQPELRAAPARLRATDVPLMCADIARARDLLGWAPVVPWSRTLRDVLDDWRRRVTDGEGG